MDGKASTVYNVLERILLDENEKPTKLPLSLLETITNNFSDERELGRGGFAVVYKGILGIGTVAVKKMSQTLDMDEEKFNKEVQCLMKVRHNNIVRFLGYCADTQGEIADYDGKFVMADQRNRLLCFEFACNGSLRDYITDASYGLEWRVRYQMIRGICDGLHYLHEKHIVHLDLKPANILLDHSMVPKIADFGLSRCFEENQSKEITSKLIGSIGYLAPEFYSGQISFKIDIYSLGVIIIEILTGNKGYSTVEKVLESWRNRIDDTTLEQVRTCAEIGIACIDSNPEKRPNIQHVIKTFRQLGGTEFVDAGVNSSIAQVGAEYASEGGLTGQKHLTTNKRKPSLQGNLQSQQPQLQNAPLPKFVEEDRSGLEAEIDRLKRDRNVLMQELVRMRQNQQTTDHQVQILVKRLKGTEDVPGSGQRKVGQTDEID